MPLPIAYQTTHAWDALTKPQLEDEVMELRAKLQAMSNERSSIEQDRDFWKREAEMWRKEFTALSKAGGYGLEGIH